MEKEELLCVFRGLVPAREVFMGRANEREIEEKNRGGATKDGYQAIGNFSLRTTTDEKKVLCFNALINQKDVDLKAACEKGSLEK